jgi:hypothetical protein
MTAVSATAAAAAAAAAPQWIGGRLAAFSQRWEKRLGSAALMETGWEPEWVNGRVPQRRALPPTPLLQPAKHTLMLGAIAEELRTGVIKRIPREQIKFKKIMNCAAFNKHVLKIRFKLEDQRLLMQLLQRNMFATSIDITAAYHHVPVASWAQPYLCFNYNNESYCY